MYSIYPGRFQPFHLGHEHIIDHAMRSLGDTGGQYVIGVIVNNVARDRDPNAEPLVGDERQAVDMNPFTVVDRMRMIAAALLQSPLKAAIALPVPRPTLYWEVIEAMFPSPRRWILPRSEDPFEKQKAAHYRRRGDLVHLVTPRTDISGTGVRSLLSAGNQQAAQMLPPAVYQYIENLRRH